MISIYLTKQTRDNQLNQSNSSSNLQFKSTKKKLIYVIHHPTSKPYISTTNQFNSTSNPNPTSNPNQQQTSDIISNNIKETTTWGNQTNEATKSIQTTWGNQTNETTTTIQTTWGNQPNEATNSMRQPIQWGNQINSYINIRRQPSHQQTTK